MTKFQLIVTFIYLVLLVIISINAWESFKIPTDTSWLSWGLSIVWMTAYYLTLVEKK